MTPFASEVARAAGAILSDIRNFLFPFFPLFVNFFYKNEFLYIFLKKGNPEMMRGCAACELSNIRIISVTNWAAPQAHDSLGISLFPVFPLFVNFSYKKKIFIYFCKKGEKPEKGKIVFEIFVLYFFLDSLFSLQF